MATKVLYKQGTKATYLGLLERQSNALYFCVDTRELYKGDDLYTDGIRFVANFAALPAYDKAADAKIYFCEDSGCGFVLNESRDGWVTVIHGVDNATIGYNADGLLTIKSVPIGSVVGLSDELQRIEGLIDTSVTGAVEELGERLTAVEQNIIGGVRYRGGVNTFEELPADAAQGDLYEVYADNSEWCFNGEKWFEYGKTTEIDFSPYATKEEIAPLISKAEVYDVANLVEYEVSHKPIGTLVDYREDEIRVLCPSDTQWTLQNSGSGADASAYYIGFKAYAPDGAVSFKEDLAEIISDDTMYYFEDNDFAGMDEYGRKYSIVWLPVAKYDETTQTWSYYGDMSSADRYIGWYYSVDWYNADGVKIAADTIRINLSNENCYNSVVPAYISAIQADIDALEANATWGEM